MSWDSKQKGGGANLGSEAGPAGSAQPIGQLGHVRKRNTSRIRFVSGHADLGLLLLLILFNVLVNFSQLGWLMLVGGVVVGALVGAILAYAPRQHRNVSQIGGLAGLVLLCLAAVAFKLTL